MSRVVITGMGIVSPLGNDIAMFRDKLHSGTSAIKPISIFNADDLTSRIAGECHLEQYQYKDRKIDFALSAVSSAIANANSFGTNLLEYYPPESRALSLGIGLELFDTHDMVRLINNNYEIPEDVRGRIDFLQTPSDVCVKIIRDKFQLYQPPAIHISACASSSDAIGQAFLRIRRGESKMIIAGGVDSMLNPMGIGGFCKLQALSTRNNAPQKASRPFDKNRDGFVLGEGAGILILENYEDAVRRKARIFAEVVGYGNSFDAYSVSEPHPEGRGAAQAILRALKSANLQPENISYINAHGTSTPKNDPVETLAIKTVFGQSSHKIPVSSTKSMIGHLIAAAGALEAIASIVCANAGFVHPTINLDEPDPLCDLDYVPHTARKHKVEYFLSNSFAFGGQNASLIFHTEEISC